MRAVYMIAGLVGAVGIGLIAQPIPEETRNLFVIGVALVWSSLLFVLQDFRDYLGNNKR